MKFRASSIFSTTKELIASEKDPASESSPCANKLIVALKDDNINDISSESLNFKVAID
jgi:hypothetical protein